MVINLQLIVHDMICPKIEWLHSGKQQWLYFWSGSSQTINFLPISIIGSSEQDDNIFCSFRFA